MKGSGERPLKVQVKAARGRSLSSKLWLDRQLNDPYVARARSQGLRSRAFKGPLWSEQEQRVRHFHRELDRYIQDKK